MQSWIVVCRISRSLAAVLLVALGACPCAGHQKWLSPNFFVAEKAPVWLSFDVTWSDKPFTAEAGVGQQPLWVVSPSGERKAPPQVFVGKTKSVAEIELAQPGTYRLESIDPLKYWTQVEENGAKNWLEKPKNEVSHAKITRADLYWSKAVAYVTVGEPSEMPAPDAAAPLDVRWGTHPNRLAVGKPVELQVLFYGKPWPNAKIKVFGRDATGHDPTRVVDCDSSGAAQIELETAGRHLFSMELEREVKDDPKADIHSFNLYVTVLVQAAEAPVSSAE